MGDCCSLTPLRLSRLLAMGFLMLFLQPGPSPMHRCCCQLRPPFVRQLLRATAAPSTLQPDAFQPRVLQGEARGRTRGVPGGVGERLLDPHSEQLLHLHHVTGIQNGTESHFSSLDVGKLGWSTSAKAHLSSAACNSCLSKSIIWGLSQTLLSRSQFFF